MCGGSTENDQIRLGDKIIFFFENSMSIDEPAKFSGEYCVMVPNKTRYNVAQETKKKKSQIID